MDFNNKLMQQEKLNTNNEYNKLEANETSYNVDDPKHVDSNINENIYFEVLTDGYHFWVSIMDMEKICTQISVTELESIGVKLNTETVFGEACVNVNDDFLIYVQKNTNNPRFVPQLGLLMTKNRDYYYKNIMEDQESSYLEQEHVITR